MPHEIQFALSANVCCYLHIFLLLLATCRTIEFTWHEGQFLFATALRCFCHAGFYTYLYTHVIWLREWQLQQAAYIGGKSNEAATFTLII